MLKIDPSERPSFVDVLKMPIVYSRILFFIEEMTLGEEVADQITSQLITLEIT